MRMEKVNKIINERNKRLDAMTFEERKKYYEEFGFKISEEKPKKKVKTKKYKR